MLVWGGISLTGKMRLVIIDQLQRLGIVKRINCLITNMSCSFKLQSFDVAVGFQAV